MERKQTTESLDCDFAKVSVIAVNESNDATYQENIEILINTGNKDCDALLKAFLFFEREKTNEPLLQLGQLSMRMFGKTTHAEKTFYRAVNYLKSYVRLFLSPIYGTA